MHTFGLLVGYTLMYTANISSPKESLFFFPQYGYTEEGKCLVPPPLTKSPKRSPPPRPSLQHKFLAV